MRFAELVATSLAVQAVRGRRKKTDALSACMLRLDPDERPIGASWLAGALPQGRIGLGYAAVFGIAPPEPASTGDLTVREVDAALTALGALSGPGSAARRASDWRALLARATADEQAFLGRLVVGELRQGALDGLVLDAIADAAQAPRDAVRRAHMLAGDLCAVAAAALTDGAAGLSRFQLTVGRPVHPMLAQTAATVEDALARLGTAAFEHKLDGVRVQVHRDGDAVRVYTRALNDVTARVPELVALVRALPNRRLILDGELLALRPDGTPHPFQTTMSRFGRTTSRDDTVALPLTPVFFDALLVDDAALLDAPASARAAALDDAVPPAHRMPRIVTDDPAVAASFYEDALAAGHEGVMAKGLDGAYEAGARGEAWLKIKAVHTLDLVILAAEWGSGRRQGWLSNLHLGARDPAGGFVMLGKTFKGLTDEMLAWQTERLSALQTHTDGWVVYVRPELVVEVAFNDVQQSPHYPGGVALRFARVKAHRPDKSPRDADTLDAVRALRPAWQQSAASNPPSAVRRRQPSSDC
jgi:DNA ligase-1